MQKEHVTHENLNRLAFILVRLWGTNEALHRAFSLFVAVPGTPLYFAILALDSK